MRALAYGEIIWDVFPEEQVIGGAPFNFVAHLAHLGNETYLISAVGKDELGLLEKSDADLPHAVATRYPNLKLVVYTLGKDGSVVLDTASGILYESGKPADVKVVSTVGQGIALAPPLPLPI